MQQAFLLKRYGSLSLMEQAYMTAEERRWWIDRIDHENQKQNQANSVPAPGTIAPSPGSPPV